MPELNRTNGSGINIDALLPQEMAIKAETIGMGKVTAPAARQFMLAVLAGAFIAMGAIFATTVATGTSGVLPFGVTKLLMGLVFSLGLILVVVGGAELFTGNNLIIMAWASRKITTLQVMKNWGIVYTGNFVGSFGTAVMMYFSGQFNFAGGEVGKMMLQIANAKCGLGFLQALVLGILCNTLVCMAVWLTFGARSTVDKIAAILFPISAFVAAGFEHSIANMYFISIGLFIKQFNPAFADSTGLALDNLTWGNFLIANLLPVTIGNVIGGAVLVGIVYWAIFLRHR